MIINHISYSLIKLPKTFSIVWSLVSTKKPSVNYKIIKIFAIPQVIVSLRRCQNSFYKITCGELQGGRCFRLFRIPWPRQHDIHNHPV